MCPYCHNLFKSLHSPEETIAGIAFQIRCPYCWGFFPATKENHIVINEIVIKKPDTEFMNELKTIFIKFEELKQIYLEFEKNLNKETHNERK
jgi:hypothetical protein